MNVQGGGAVVTGGASGIGRAIALELGRRGCAVAVADIDGAAATQVAKEVAALGVTATGHACDVTESGAIEALAEAAASELPRVNLLFNNAGVGAPSPLLEGSADDLRWILEVNLVGVWKGCAVFGKHFVAQGEPAWICNTGSEHSLGLAHVGMGFYSASKAALLGLSDVLRGELPDHVGVSLACPGMVDTGLWNATRHRPDRFGGAGDADAFSGKVQAHGMEAGPIGARIVDGVEAGAPIIVTHSQARRYAEARWNQIREAFDAQAPYREEDERYDVTGVIGRLLSGDAS
ncbi:MAG: SDR family NAD(P)-dependent oxidoreductase [Myxococcota bacterium]